MNLTRGNGVGRLHLGKSSCHAHLFGMPEVILSSFRLSLLILDHHVTYHSELLCLRRCQHATALSYYHLRVVVLLSNLAGLKQSMGSLKFIGDHNLVLFKVSIAWPEDVIDILGSKLSCDLSINDLFFLSVLFQHWVKQSVHALWLVQAEHVSLLMLVVLLGLIFTSFDWRLMPRALFTDVEGHI